MAKILAVSLLLLTFFALPAQAQNQGLNNSFREVPESVRSLQQENTLMQGKAAEFRARIAQIQDAQKQRIVENIVEKISGANTRITTKMNDALDKLSIILDRVESTAENLSTSGVNTTNLLSSIVAAEAAIQTAREAVAEQAEKEYTANITTDATLRNTIGAMVSEFRNDIRSVFELVRNAKTAVQDAIREARSLGNNSTETTGSANINIE